MDKVRSVELLMEFFNSIGGIVLLRQYECPKGMIDLIVKHKGRLLFIGISSEEDVVRKVAKYYMKRYGIQAVDYDVVSL